MSKSIALLVGSLRKDSYNLKIAKLFQEYAPASLKLKIVEIGDLPFYNEDIDGANPPASYTRFRNEIAAVDGVIFVTPEYNRSTTAVIKNAIDVGSRPYGKSVWAKKPTAVASVSMGAQGGFGANHHLRQSLVFLDMPVMQQPEFYFGSVQNAFDEKGNLKESSVGFVKTFIEAYATWIAQLTK